MPIRTGKVESRCAATAASTAACGRLESRAHAVAGVLEQPASVRLDRVTQHFVVGGERSSHPVGVGLPPPRRTLDVGEQKCQQRGSRRPSRPFTQNAINRLHTVEFCHRRM